MQIAMHWILCWGFQVTEGQGLVILMLLLGFLFCFWKATYIVDIAWESTQWAGLQEMTFDLVADTD